MRLSTGQKILWVFALGISAAMILLAGAASAPNDPFFAEQVGLKQIRGPEAWEHATGEGVTIAIIDSGVDANHPDFTGRLVGTNGQDLVDLTGHGTHVAGIAAAGRDDGVGIAGVAPDAEILSIGVCDDPGVCDTETYANAIRLAAELGAQVINVSIGEGLVIHRVDGTGELLSTAISYARELGAVVVAAAGNSSLPICQDPGGYPGSICVGAVNARDVMALYSSHTFVPGAFLVAPGSVDDSTAITGESCGGVVSSFPANFERTCAARGVHYMHGTSMAAPFVAGVAALLASQGLNADEIIERLLSTAVDLGAPGVDPIYGYGRVDALAAVTR